MIKWMGRLALAVLSLSVLARAASAQAYEPVYASDRPTSVEGHGYEYGYESGSQSSRSDSSVYEGDRYGERREQTSGGSDVAYEYGYGSAYAYRSDDRSAGYEERYVAEAEPCDWRRVPNPRDPYACPAGWGTVTLSDGFSAGGGGVGDGYGYAYGGGGGGGYAYAGAGASASAYASASARVSIGYRGGGKGGHRPGKPRGGCGCKH